MVKILVGGKEANVSKDSFAFSKKAGSDDELTFTINVKPGDNYDVRKGSSIVVEEHDGTVLYKGFVYDSDEREHSEYGEKYVDVDCIGQKWILQKKHVSVEIDDRKVGEFLEDFIPSLNLGFTLGFVHNKLEEIAYIKYDYIKVSDLFDKVVDQIGGHWYIDVEGKINFVKIGTVNGGKIIEDDINGDIIRGNSNDGYANKVVLSNYFEKRQKIEYKIGNGTETVFTLSHPINKIISMQYSYFDQIQNKTVRVEILPEEIKERGEEGSGEPGVKVNYTRGSDTIEWVDSYVLINTDVLEIYYEGLVKLKKSKTDNEELIRFREISGVTQPIETLIEETVIGEDKADKLMDLVLANKKEDAIVLKFNTEKHLEVGKTYECDFPSLGIKDEFIVNSVVYDDIGVKFSYKVEISRGNYNIDWSRFYSNLDISSSKEIGLGSASGNGYQEIEVNLSLLEVRQNRPTDVQMGRIWLKDPYSTSY